jgi:hypothetical protein
MDIAQIIVGLIVGFLTGYLTSYFQEKGKNKALLSDIKRLTEEKEKVVTEFQLDLAKRKYQYETKKEQYFKYFNLIDQFNAEGNKQVYEKFLPIINKFNKDFLAAQLNKKKELLATNAFSDAVNKMMLENNDKLFKIKHETNTIKLIAGEKVLSLLNDLEYYYDLSFDKSSALMKQMGQLIVERQDDRIKEGQIELEAIGQLINRTKQQLVSQVRQELNEI